PDKANQILFGNLFSRRGEQGLARFLQLRSEILPGISQGARPGLLRAPLDEIEVDVQISAGAERSSYSAQHSDGLAACRCLLCDEGLNRLLQSPAPHAQIVNDVRVVAEQEFRN